jgi:hypothetical protein
MVNFPTGGSSRESRKLIDQPLLIILAERGVSSVTAYFSGLAATGMTFSLVGVIGAVKAATALPAGNLDKFFIFVNLLCLFTSGSILSI